MTGDDVLQRSPIFLRNRQLRLALVVTISVTTTGSFAADTDASGQSAEKQVEQPSPAVVLNEPTAAPLDEQTIRQLFLGATPQWPDGSRVIIVLPPHGSAEMDWLCASLRVSENLLVRGLMEKALRGDILRPVRARDNLHALELVESTRGAVTVATIEASENAPTNASPDVGASP